MVDALPQDLQNEYNEAKQMCLDQANTAFAQFDTNNDGTITKEELAELAKSGKLSPPGVTAEQAEQQLLGWMSNVDQNGDGKVTKQEMATFTLNIFDNAVIPALQARAAGGQ